jgi:hypothetical protein
MKPYTPHKARLQGKKEGVMDTTKLLEGFRDDLKRAELLPTSLNTYVRTARRFLEFLEMEKRALKDPEAAKEFLGVRKSSPDKTQLRSFYDYLLRRKLVPRNFLGPLNANWSYLRTRDGKAKDPVTPAETLLKDDPAAIVPLSGLPPEAPSQETFTSQKQQREIAFLRNHVRRLLEAIRQRDNLLMEQRDLWQLGLDHGIWPTMGEALSISKKFESVINYRGPTLPQGTVELDAKWPPKLLGK